jgi:amidase
MDVTDYAACDATELRTVIASNQVTRKEVIDAARHAIAQVEPRLNAVVAGPFDDIDEGSTDAPFGGVPVAVKDTLFESGRPVTIGSRLLDGFVSPFDSTVAARLRDAGFVSMVRTATPEFAFNPDTAPVTTGRVSNPWAPDRSPGGSSGGSAALVAARAMPIAHGNDGGGSIRLPAGWCGLVGLKPTRGRVPVGPGMGEILVGHGQEFALTRTVRDAAATLDALNGPSPGDR